jgi:hypothetical protein
MVRRAGPMRVTVVTSRSRIRPTPATGRPAMADWPRVGRGLILLGWLWLGWHYLAH